jgi:hypothetical protein
MCGLSRLMSLLNVQLQKLQVITEITPVTGSYSF